jgi:hypothetical protein
MKTYACNVIIHIHNTKGRRIPLSIPACTKNRFRWLSRVLLVLFSLILVSQTAGAAESKEEPITSESIKQNHPEVYKKIQQEEKYREPVNPDKPYGDYGGFWALPTFKPDQPHDWWERSSFEYSPEYPFFLKRITSQLSYLRLSGSSEGTLATGSIALNLRKGRISNSLSYAIDQKLVKHESGYTTLDRDLQTFEETLKYELNRHLFIEAGMFWRRISTVYIKDRYVPFIGIGTYNILDTIVKNKKDLLGIELGAAKVFDTYYPYVSDITHSKSDSYTAVYLKADYTHIFNSSLTYRQNFLLKNAVDKTPVYQESADWTSATIQYYNLRYDWRWTNSLEYNYNRFIGAYVSYAVIYDSNPWPTKSKQDTELMVGLRLSHW